MTTLAADKILLVHSLGYNTGDANLDVARITNLMPPLGLANLAAYPKRQNIEPTTVPITSRRKRFTERSKQATP